MKLLFFVPYVFFLEQGEPAFCEFSEYLRHDLRRFPVFIAAPLFDNPKASFCNKTIKIFVMHSVGIGETGQPAFQILFF